MLIATKNADCDMVITQLSSSLIGSWMPSQDLWASYQHDVVNVMKC